MRPWAPVAPVSPFAPWGPCAPWGPVGPATLEGTHLAPLNTRAWPLVGALVVRSRGVPCSFSTSSSFWVPVTSPLKGPVTIQAALAWKAGMMDTSGVIGWPARTTWSFRPALPSMAVGMGGIPAPPRPTAYRPSVTVMVRVPEFHSSAPVLSRMLNTNWRAPLTTVVPSTSRPW